MLPNIRMLFLGGNRFTGAIPHSISNASKLEWLDFSLNFFTGSIPVNLGNLKNLKKLNFGVNNLGTRKADDLSFLNSLVNCTYLEVVAFGNNSLSGMLPTSVANLSTHLYSLYMGANRISGSIPTEYAVTGEVSTSGDVYSFGIVLLEMFTGRRPIDDMFTERLSLHNFAKAAIPDQVIKIVEPTILEEALQVQDGSSNHQRLKPNWKSQIHEILVSILRVGVLSSAESPSDRIQIKEVIKELQDIRKIILAMGL
ncbi:hypothetical protein LWI28_012336 [Acer negundo]|uniref:Serine-threonine/tyrosine-protein kinase catalytic domain-containing protein n=1 Tax=Acer negundo TaxID=4023 RepID=A0AAD5NF98_ACENE|nr:hypothetical protein LWI28_012336 [Acer negundo]